VAKDGPDRSLGVVLFALRVAGYHVEVVPTALQALQRGHSLRPDALIVPLLMPDMVGADLADRLGSAAARAHTLAVVILVPTDGAPRGGNGPITAGATFCHLPCHPRDLVAMVGKQLAAIRLLGGPLPSES
jgi:CheY-like chemotaxis protein